MADFTIYVSGAGFVAEDSDSAMLTVKGVDLSELVAEIGTTQLLEAMDRADVYDWTDKERKLDEEYNLERL